MDKTYKNLNYQKAKPTNGYYNNSKTSQARPEFKTCFQALKRELSNKDQKPILKVQKKPQEPAFKNIYNLLSNAQKPYTCNTKPKTLTMSSLQPAENHIPNNIKP